MARSHDPDAATLNQVEDPGRILSPMKRVGPRGSGRFERTSWNEVLDVFAAKIRAAVVEGRKIEIVGKDRGSEINAEAPR